MILRLADLRAVTSHIFDAIERRFDAEIDLESLPFGYRWELDLRDIFVVQKDPSAPSLGDLGDDLNEILDILRRADDEAVVWHDLGHLIGLLQLLAVLDLPPDDVRPHQTG